MGTTTRSPRACFFAPVLAFLRPRRQRCALGVNASCTLTAVTAHEPNNGWNLNFECTLSVVRRLVCCSSASVLLIGLMDERAHWCISCDPRGSRCVEDDGFFLSLSSSLRISQPVSHSREEPEQLPSRTKPYPLQIPSHVW